MSNPISRRTFLKCTGASAVALGAAGLLGGCQQSGGDTIVDVKVGDKISNWNGLGVMLTSLFRIDTAPAQEGYEYIAVLVTVVNRTKNQTFNIGAQNLAEINAAYPAVSYTHLMPVAPEALSKWYRTWRAEHPEFEKIVFHGRCV